MKQSMILALTISLCGCTSGIEINNKKVDPPAFESNFKEKIYIETHNNEKHCLVRIWAPARTEEAPLVIFRGTPGQETCKIYTITNPDYSLEGNNER